MIGGTGAPQHVVVDFAPKAVALVEPREWHHSQRSTRLDDGGLRVYATIRLAVRAFEAARPVA